MRTKIRDRRTEENKTRRQRPGVNTNGEEDIMQRNSYIRVYIRFPKEHKTIVTETQGIKTNARNIV